MKDRIQGIHHITGIAGDAQRNLDFYTGVLGLRMVKRTVNFDDPGTYHFYFGDETGKPGTILTFFPWGEIRRGQPGAGQVGVTAFSVPQRSMGFWQDRLSRLGVTTGAPFSRLDEEVLALVDPDGLPLELVARPMAAAAVGWAHGSVPASYAIRGFAAPTLFLTSAEATLRLLMDTFGMSLAAESGSRCRITAGLQPEGLRGDMLDIEIRPSEPRGRNGAGIIHHIAFRVENDQVQLDWREKLISLGFDVTPVLDRQYFHSIYFREPGGVLFEIATEAPGFSVDEPVEALGEHLKLPPWFESQRAKIESVLPPLTASNQYEQR